MRHNKNFNHLGRQAGHRKALMSNMASSLILHKRIETTVAKAKAVRQFIEPLVTKSKDDSTHSRRIVFSYLKQKEAVTELFRTIAPKIAERPGGYTRILKTGFRLGDAADMCIIEFVDFNDAYTLGIAPAAAAEAKPKTRRSRKPAAKKTDAVEEAHTVLASDLINEQLALLAGLPEEQMGLGHAFEMDPRLQPRRLPRKPT
jgi:large subunit ribosomal protein L17